MQKLQSFEGVEEIIHWVSIGFEDSEAIFEESLI